MARLKIKKPSLTRIFNGKKLHLTRVTGYGLRKPFPTTKQLAVRDVKELRKQGYTVRLVHSKTHGYLVYSDKPMWRIPW